MSLRSPITVLGVGLLAASLAAACAPAVGTIDDPGSDPPAGSDPAVDGGGGGGGDGAAPTDDSTPPGDDTAAPSDPSDTGSGGGGTDTAPPPADTAPPPDPTSGLGLVKGLAISEIAVFQGVKVSIEKSGAKTTSRKAPVVAGREGVLRVYVTPGAGYSPQAVTGVLTLTRGGGAPVVLTDVKTISAASSDGSLASTFDFELDSASLATDTQYSVALKVSGGGGAGSEAAAYPLGGAAESLDAQSGGDVLKVKLVPVQYGADGSNRLPDTSAAQVERYRAEMYRIYPAKKVEITVRAPYAYSSPIDAGGSGWSEVLQALTNLRESDGAPSDVYYFGAFAPASSFDSYCSGGCVTGLSGLITDPSDTFGRASVGVGYTGDVSAETMAHEVGHAHGRSHADCGGASGIDPSYPYGGAGIGSWGYDITSKSLLSPTKYTDMMGYCNPVWVSDYTYGALFKRMAYVAAHPMIVRPAGAPARWRFVGVAADGSLKWGDELTVRSPPIAEPHTIEYVAADGRKETVTGVYYPYNDLPGGYLLVPVSTLEFSTMHVLDMPSGVATHLSAP